MKKEKTLMVVTAILLILVAAVALLVCNSWYLYCGVVLIGYVALMQLTVRLKQSVHIEYLNLEQYIRDKNRFYGIVAICYGAVSLINIILLIAVQGSIDIRVLFMFLNFMVALITLIIALCRCESKDIQFWLPKILSE